MATEQRLIDANELPLGKFVEPRTEWHQGWNDALDAAMLQAPTVDAVPVVYCKDCARCKKGYCTIRKDSWGATLLVGQHDYCSDGERRTDNGC